MSWATCYKATNNIHYKYPAMMDSGNLYTDWNTACKTNNLLKEKAGITDNYEYRQWLINNSNTIIKQNQQSAMQDTCVNVFPQFTQRKSKYIFRNCNDKSKPFGYDGSDLKNMYLSREQLQERLTAPIMTQHDLIKNGISNHF
tara:strand:+ start:255 stop:683 length:429 start_codon:yes stop_codon:yes gene_type:complete